MALKHRNTSNYFMRIILGLLFQCPMSHAIQELTNQLRDKFCQAARVPQPSEWMRNYSHCPGANKTSWNDPRKFQVVILTKRHSERHRCSEVAHLFKVLLVIN